jgi:hypothetical protein
VADTWLTPYLAAWEQYQGAVTPGRLAKAVKPAHDMLGDDGPPAFEAFCMSRPGLKPEWFAPNCKQWVEAVTTPLVSPTGLLTERGRRVYAGGER